MQASTVERLNKIWRSTPRFLKNKYSLVLMLFFMWLLFFDPNNFIRRMKSYNNLEKLDNEKQYYVKRIEESRKDLYEIKNDKDNIEKYAREKYYMKNENEDVFVIKETENKE